MGTAGRWARVGRPTNEYDSDEAGEAVPMVAQPGPRTLSRADLSEFEILVRRKMEVCGERCDLSGRGVGDNEVGIVLEELHAHRGVRFVDLSANALGGGCGKTIAMFLQANSSVTHLNLSSNGIDDAALAHVAAALAFNKTLATLDIRGNAFSARGASAMLHAMDENPNVSIFYEGEPGDERGQGCVQRCACAVM